MGTHLEGAGSVAPYAARPARCQYPHQPTDTGAAIASVATARTWVPLATRR